MSLQSERASKKPLWLILILLSLSLLQCRISGLPQLAQPVSVAPAEPSPPLEERVGPLQASQMQLVAGEVTDVRVGVVRQLDAPDPFEYQWGTTGGIISYGQNSCCITYQAPEQPGAYQVNLSIKYDDQVVQRSLSIEVIAPTPTPEPSPTPVLTPTATLTPANPAAPDDNQPASVDEPADEPLETAEDYFERAQVYYIQRKYDRTVADYTKAIELNYEPLYEPYYNRGYVYYVEGKYDQAIDDFSQALELNYDPPSLVHYNRGNAYYYKGNNRKAVDDYTKAIEMEHEPLSWLYNNRGLAYRKQGKLEEAIADYTKAIEMEHEPLNWPYYNRGNAFADLGDYTQAIGDFSEALRIDPSSTDAYYGRGLAYKELGDVEKASADFIKVTELGNDFWRQQAQDQLRELGIELKLEF